jgi:hypothetical protein
MSLAEIPVPDLGSAGTPGSGLAAGPLFVVGLWRSGTSLLYVLLNQHPQIALLYEADLPMLRPLFYVPRPKASWLERWDFWNDSVKRHHLSADAVAPQSDGVGAATEAAYRSYAQAKGAVIWGEKSPNWCDDVSSVARDFPAARFIVIWRSPLSIARSIARAAEQEPFFQKRGTMLRALLGCERLKRECDRLLQAGVPLHQLRYEDMVRNPEGSMQAICDFLQIPFDPRMATLEGANRSTIDSGAQHEMVMGGQIVSKRDSKEVLPSETKEKILRYLRLWQDRYGDNWLLLKGWAVEPGDRPGSWERFRDELLYRLLRALDFAVVAIYAYSPLWLLRAYRAGKRSSATGPAKVEGSSGA